MEVRTHLDTSIIEASIWPRTTVGVPPIACHSISTKIGLRLQVCLRLFACLSQKTTETRSLAGRNIRTHFSLNYTFLLFSLAFLKLKYNFFKPKCLHHDRGLGEETKDLKETKDTIFSAELEIALLVLPLQLIILSHFHHISVYRQAHLNNVPYRRKPPQMHISPTS